MYSFQAKSEGDYLLEDLLQVETILEQGSSRVNEDRLCVTADVFGVFDGSTSLSKECSHQKVTGGEHAADITSTIFAQQSGSLASRMRRANQEIAEAMEEHGINCSYKENLWSTSASIVRLHENNLEWCQIGDCRLVLLYDDGAHRIISAPVDHDRETLNLMAELGGLSNAMGQPAMHEQIVQVRRQMNRDYGVLCGEMKALDFVRAGLEPLVGVTDVLLFSDGLLLPDGETDGITHLVALYKSGGLQAMRDYVRRIQEQDADCVLWPRFKKHDDISAIALHLNTQ